MAKKGRRKNRRPSVPVVADSGPTKLPTSNSSCPSGVDDPDKNSTSNPSIVESLDWETCTQEEQLEKIIRKILYDLYLEALARLVREGYDEDVALKGLLERGYCVGEADCLSSIVLNSLEFLTGEDVVESEEQDQPQPFQNLELLVDFNLHFMFYILQKYRPNLNRICIRRCILMTDLNLNRAIIMNIKDTPFEITDMPSDLNLEDDNGEKDGFLVLESREMLDKLNILDDSVVSEDMKDAMIDDLKPRVKERIRWASKKVAQAIRKQPSTIMSLLEELWQFQHFLESILEKRESELSSANIGLANAEETKKRLEMEKEEIKAEISASKLIESEAKQKCLDGSKKGRWKKWQKEKMKLRMDISKWERQLDENEAAIIEAEVELGEVTKARKAAIAQIYIEYQVALEKWDIWKRKIEALKIRTNGERNILGEHMEGLKKLLTDAISYVTYELQD